MSVFKFKIWSLSADQAKTLAVGKRVDIYTDGNFIEHTLNVETGKYHLAVAAIPALFDKVTLPALVLLWYEAALPDYGPYWYFLREDEFGRLVCGTCAPVEKK